MQRSSARGGRGEGRSGDPHREHGIIESRLAEALQQAGWNVFWPGGSDHGGRQPDFVVRKGELAYAVECKSSALGARQSVLEGALADAILRARRAAEQSGLRPLAVVCAASLSDSMVERLERYAAEFGDAAAWGLMDRRGRLVLRGEGLESVPESRPRPAAGRQRARKSSHANVFSDLGQWMLKVLLAEEIPASLLNAPRAGFGVASVSALAERADVSLASASKFLSAMSARGFVEQERGEVEIVLRDQLMRAWASAGSGDFEELPARVVFPSRDPLARMKSELARLRREWPEGAASRVRERAGSGSAARASRACLGLFAACDALGVGIVRGARPHIFVEGFDLALLDELGLELVDPGGHADVLLRKPNFPESLFRGCVNVDGVPVADVLQCWIDVWSHPVRGQEQAEAIRGSLVQLGVFE